MPIELVFVIGIAILLFLCLKVKANAFISLLATALAMGMPFGYERGGCYRCHYVRICRNCQEYRNRYHLWHTAGKLFGCRKRYQSNGL